MPADLRLRAASPQVSIVYRREGYDTRVQRLLGRHSASEGFLRALLASGRINPIGCQARTRAEFEDFCKLVQPWFTGERELRFVDASSFDAMGACGTLHRPDSMLADEAFRRRYLPAGSRAYGITGVTHTIASKHALRGISDLLLAPFEPWDALICTSQSVRTTIDRLLAEWADYLQARTGGRPTTPVRLPVIPLGIHCDAFPQGEAREATRKQFRSSIGAASGDFVVLFVGRLIFYAKAHPAPMYLALERLAKTVATPIHLVQAGWFENDKEAEDFRASAASLAPSVKCHFVDGRLPEIRANVWSGADLFLSLSDNIQETFGLTPIEAMANGLPVIVSDWDGYRESVRHEVDGLCIPSIVPGGEAGAGAGWAAQYLVEDLGYSNYVAYCSMSTAIDVEACAVAVRRLLENADLRHRLGENGRRRAHEVYDWRVVIRSYEDLWAELGEARAHAPTVSPAMAPGAPAVPWLDDPYRQFAHYATAAVSGSTGVTLGSMAHPDGLRTLTPQFSFRFGAQGRAGDDHIGRILAFLRAHGPATVEELAAAHADIPSHVLVRTLTHLAKFDVLRLEVAAARPR